MTNLRTLLAILALILSSSVQAGPQADAAKTCLADSTNGKDRKVLAKWIFLSIAAHPEIKTLSRATDVDAEQASRAVGTLFTRLIAENCPNEIRAMVKSEGAASLRTTFEFLGGLAMQELTASPEVKTSVSLFERFVDRSRISAILEDR
jgi:hypothetical protein